MFKRFHCAQDGVYCFLSVKQNSIVLVCIRMSALVLVAGGGEHPILMTCSNKLWINTSLDLAIISMQSMRVFSSWYAFAVVFTFDNWQRIMLTTFPTRRYHIFAMCSNINNTFVCVGHIRRKVENHIEHDSSIPSLNLEIAKIF